MENKKRRIGLIGMGHLGQFLAENLLDHPEMEIAFLWNRSPIREPTLLQKYSKWIISSLDNIAVYTPDLIVEVAHPSISETYGEYFLDICDYFIGSPTALSDEHLFQRLKEKSKEVKRAIYIPAGALWGQDNIQKMADNNTLKGLIISMKKHPSCFKLRGDLKKRNENIVANESIVLYEGSVRNLCPLAPNNVNTMAAAAIAAHNLGFDKVMCKLVSDPSLKDFHVVEVEVIGPSTTQGESFTVSTIRKNPSAPGGVTGSATFSSFLSSLHGAQFKNSGIHLV